MSRKKLPKVTIALIAVNCILFLLAEIFSGSTENNLVLVTWGGAYTPMVNAGQYWRLFTSMFVHAGIRHLLNNMLLLYVLGSALEALLGPVRYAVLYLAGGLLGNIAAWRYYVRLQQDVVTVGASGAVFAVMGALIGIIFLRRGRVQGLSLKEMLIMLGLSLYFGFTSSGVANSAHIGGLISGFVLGLLFFLPVMHRGKKSADKELHF